MAVIDELILRKGTTRYPIDSYDNKMIDEIVYEGQSFHFAKQKDLTGTSEIVADNGVDEPIISLGVSGDTFQQTYQGTNLATAYQIFADRSSYLETEFEGRNCIRYKCNTTIKKTIASGFKENTQYTISGWYYSVNIEGYGDTGYINYIWYTDGTVEYYYVPKKDEWVNVTYTTKAGKTVEYIGMQSSAYKTYVYVDIDTFQINEGTKVLPYEPYVGGKYSPNPEFPQPIENTNDNGMSVVVHGTNLATAYQIFADRNQYTELEFDGRECIRYQCDKATNKVIEGGFKENTQYTLSCWAYATVRTSPGNDRAYLYIIYYTDGTNNSVYLNTVNTWEYSKFTTKANKTVATISMRAWSYMKDVYVDVNTFQINEGTQVLPYEPYFRETVEIPTSIDVNGTSVPLLFSEYDKLLVDRLNNKVVYETYAFPYTYTGEESYSLSTWASNLGYGNYYQTIPKNNVAFSGVLASTHFKKGRWTQANIMKTQTDIVTYTGTWYIAFKTDGTQSLDDFKAWIKAQYDAGTPVKVIAKRRDAVERDITNTDLGQALLALATRQGTNYLEISSDLAPSQTDLSYWRQIIPGE